MVSSNLSLSVFRSCCTISILYLMNMSSLGLHFGIHRAINEWSDTSLLHIFFPAHSGFLYLINNR
jgi:hypothetical protein